ncbi:MAG: DUF218 domain-containing protein [Clostridia bacterium]|nr:DUF218 domain-containing protein [Clostridia bacterium]MBT7121415.1 DUF218 domain-containing protein [Clostridia bacterium]
MLKRYLRISLIFMMALFLVVALVFVIINAVVIGSAGRDIYDISDIETLEPAQCVLVLGAKVYSNERLSPVLLDRVDYAIAIYKAGKAAAILFSGDHGQTEYDEVNAMMNYAISKGVPKEDIFLDHAGFSTYESLVRAKEVFCVTDTIIVTQRFHISRAVYIAQSLGLNASGVNSDPRRYRNAGYDALRESLARVKDFFFVNVSRPDPTYLGDKIPILGDSGLTHDKD